MDYPGDDGAHDIHRRHDQAKGLGLGLSIVQRVIAILPKHSMRFWSVEGRGSRFSLYAPVSITTPVIGTDDRKCSAYASILKGRYVLLCDDEPTVLEGLRRLFLSAGALVDTAESMIGFEAILADERRAPDIIVTDIRLRDGPTGIEVAERLQAAFRLGGRASRRVHHGRTGVSSRTSQFRRAIRAIAEIFRARKYAC